MPTPTPTPMITPEFLVTPTLVIAPDTPEQTARHLSAAIDSVNLINSLTAIGPTANNKLVAFNNAAHLEIMQGRGVSNAATLAAISAAGAFNALAVIADLPAPPAPIANVTPRQIRMALTRAGLRVAVEAAVAAGDQDLQDWYGFSTTFERNHAQVNAMGAALNVSAKSIDDLWALGATL